MNMSVLVAQAPAASRAGSPGVALTEPAFHSFPLLPESGGLFAGQSKIVLENRRGPPAKLAGIIGPDAGAPVAEATGLARQQIKKRIAVARLGGADVLRFFGKQGAHLVHGAQH